MALESTKRLIAASALILTLLPTGIVKADSDCGVADLQEEENSPPVFKMPPQKAEKDSDDGEHTPTRIEKVADRIACISGGYTLNPNDPEELVYSEEKAVNAPARLKELAKTLSISLDFQKTSPLSPSGGPVTMAVTGRNASLFFNPVLTDAENASAGYALLMELFTRLADKEPMDGVYKLPQRTQKVTFSSGPK